MDHFIDKATTGANSQTIAYNSVTAKKLTEAVTEFIVRDLSTTDGNVLNLMEVCS